MLPLAYRCLCALVSGLILTGRTSEDGSQKSVEGVVKGQQVQDVAKDIVKREASSKRVLVFTSIVEPPFLMKSPTNSDKEEFVGFIPDLVQRMAERMGFRYRLQLVKEGAYGARRPDGTWNGMIGEVMSKESDVAAGALTVLSSRKNVISFTSPFMETGIAAVTYATNENADSSDITSPLDLANRTGLHYGMISGSLTYSYFRAMAITNVTIQRMWQRMTSAKPPAFEWSSQRGIDRVRESKGNYAFLVEKVFAEHLTANPPCNLRVTPNTLNPRDYAFAVRKGSNLLRRLNRIIAKLKANGFLDRLRRKWWRGKCIRQSEEAALAAGGALKRKNIQRDGHLKRVDQSSPTDSMASVSSNNNNNLPATAAFPTSQSGGGHNQITNNACVIQSAHINSLLVFVTWLLLYFHQVFP